MKRVRGILLLSLTVSFLVVVSKAYAPPGWCWRWGGRWGGGPWWSYGTKTTLSGVLKGVYPPYANLITKDGKTIYVMMGPPWTFYNIGLNPKMIEGQNATIQGYLYGATMRAISITVNGKTYTLPYGPGGGWRYYNQYRP